MAGIMLEMRLTILTDVRDTRTENNFGSGCWSESVAWLRINETNTIRVSPENQYKKKHSISIVSC